MHLNSPFVYTIKEGVCRWLLFVTVSCSLLGRISRCFVRFWFFCQKRKKFKGHQESYTSLCQFLTTVLQYYFVISKDYHHKMYRIILFPGRFVIYTSALSNCLFPLQAWIMIFLLALSIKKHISYNPWVIKLYLTKLFRLARECISSYNLKKHISFNFCLIRL